MLNKVFNFFCLMFFSLMAASLFIKITELPFWWGVLFLVIMGISLYLTSVLLINHFIEKRAPGVMELDELYGKPMSDGEYLWEKTASAGIVPKWVSWIGIWSMASFTGILVWIIIHLIK